ncbi:uncharacterized protein Fot_31370 [Forsythia ovata]|uniref:Uncharacterized protein n=1 Tax=Forsythia ovata TaxID=205694 RepID=A0ABD1T5A8_9LAMI
MFASKKRNRSRGHHNICGDCKFLFLEVLEATTPDSYQRRILGLRRIRYNSSKSIESLFSYQFPQMITLAKQTQSTVLEHDNQFIDGDGAARLVQLMSTRTTLSGSRRWRRVFSDTESDGFDSFYRENESNVSFRRYRHFPGEDDTISYTTYGGDFDASIDECHGRRLSSTLNIDNGIGNPQCRAVETCLKFTREIIEKKGFSESVAAAATLSTSGDSVGGLQQTPGWHLWAYAVGDSG